jgi:hypothetical protein
MEITVDGRKVETSAKRYSIDEYHSTQEIGGIFWGNKETFRIERIIQLRNAHKEPQNYYKWSKLSVLYYFFFKLGLKQLLLDLKNNNWIVGDWHSEPAKEEAKFSNVDMEMFRRRVAQYGRWLAGLLKSKDGGNRATMYINLYKKNNTMFKTIPQ